MAQVSRVPLRKEISRRVFEIFLETIADLKKPQEVGEFIDEFLSDTERTVLAKRLSIAVLLAKGYDYDSIRQILKVSPPTIAAVNNAMRKKGHGYQRVLARILAAEETRQLWLDIEEIFNLFPPKGRSWQDWGKKKSAIRRKRRRPL